MTFSTKIVFFTVLFMSYVYSSKGEPYPLIFEKLHEDISQIQNYAHGEAFNINFHLSNELNSIYLNLFHKRGHTVDDIHEESQKIIKRLKLNEEEPKIRACVQTKNSSTTQLIYETIGATTICRILTENKRNEVYLFIDELYARQQREHIELENTKNYCNNTNEDEIYKSCLLNNLIDVRAPSIQILKGDTEFILQKFKENSGYLEEKYRNCMELTEGEILGGGKKNILVIFEECCKN